MRRGEIWVGNLNPNRGAEVGKIRPVLIIQADFQSHRASQRLSCYPDHPGTPRKEPLHVTIQARDRLLQTSQVVPEQPRTLDRKRLIEGPLTTLSPEEMLAVERSLSAVLGVYR